MTVNMESGERRVSATDSMLQQEAARLVGQGWEITTASPDMISLVREKNANGLAVAIGCLLGILPGIFIYLIGRGRESKVLTRAGIEAQIAANKRAEEVARQRREKIMAYKAEHKFLGVFGGSTGGALVVIALILSALACIGLVVIGSIAGSGGSSLIPLV